MGSFTCGLAAFCAELRPPFGGRIVVGGEGGNNGGGGCGRRHGVVAIVPNIVGFATPWRFLFLVNSFVASVAASLTDA